MNIKNSRKCRLLNLFLKWASTSLKYISASEDIKYFHFMLKYFRVIIQKEKYHKVFASLTLKYLRRGGGK